MTSTGASSAPTWQTAIAPVGNTTYYTSFTQTLYGFAAGLNTFQPITFVIPSLTATYLMSCSTTTGVNSTAPLTYF